MRYVCHVLAAALQLLPAYLAVLQIVLLPLLRLVLTFAPFVPLLLMASQPVKNPVSLPALVLPVPLLVLPEFFIFSSFRAPSAVTAGTAGGSSSSSRPLP